MVRHDNHVVYMLHPLRGLYDTYHFFGMPADITPVLRSQAERALATFVSQNAGDPAYTPMAGNPDGVAFPIPAGNREALYRRGLPVDAGLVARLEAVDDGAGEAFLAAREPDGIVCANDRTAGRWMHALQRLGRAVPGDVRIVGIDDVEYAELLPVPLTTFRQPTRAIGAVALGTLLERIARPAQPTRDVLLHGELVVRRSCGARVG